MIPTAEEFLEMNPFASYWYDEKSKTTVCRSDEVEKIMKEYAKLHIEAALKAASEKAKAKEDPNDYGTGEIWVDKKSILSAYPLTLIK